MFLANGTLWQVGLLSGEAVWMHNAEVPDPAPSPLPVQRRWGQRIPVPIQPCLAVGNNNKISINNSKKRSSQCGFWYKAGAGEGSLFRTPQGMGQIVHCLVSLDGLSGKDVEAKQKLLSCLQGWFLQCNSGWQSAGACLDHLMILSGLQNDRSIKHVLL